MMNKNNKEPKDINWHVFHHKILPLLRAECEKLRFFIPFAKRIGYIGWLGYGNLGDEAMFRAFKKLFPEFNVIPFKRFGIITLFEKILRQKAFEAVFMGGGTLVNNDWVRYLKAAQEKYSPTFIFGTGVEEVPLSNEWLGCLNKCGFVGVRGPLSKQALSNIGFNNSEIIGDLMLTLALDEASAKPREKKLGLNIGLENIGTQKNEEAVLEFVVKLAKVMLEKKWKITFYPVISSDLPYIREAVRRIGKPVQIFKDYNSVAKMMDSIKQCDLFVGEKLHSTVIAICMSTPAIMLEYEQKCLDFMMSMDLQKFNVKTDNLSLDVVMNLLEELDNNLEYFQAKIAKKAIYYKQLQREKSRLITQIISSPQTNTKI